MILRIDAFSRLTLEEPDNLRALKLIAVSQKALELHRTGGGPVEPADGFAWIRRDWLMAESGLSDSAEWRTGFAAMVAYARNRGWVREEDGALRAHVEFDPGDIA